MQVSELRGGDVTELRRGKMVIGYEYVLSPYKINGDRGKGIAQIGSNKFVVLTNTEQQILDGQSVLGYHYDRPTK